MQRLFKFIDLSKHKISVIIPCYNYGQYLVEALESVFCQTANCKIEVIIVNDGSTEERTLRVLKQIEEEDNPNIKIIHQTNKGLSSARNNGAKYAKTEFIMFLDADDKLAPEFIDKALKVIISGNNIDIVYSYVEIFGDMKYIWRTQNLSLKRILRYNSLPSTAAFRKNLWSDVGGYDRKMKEGYEDWEFWIRCAQKGYRGFAIPECLFKYRRHGETMHYYAGKKHSKIKKYIREKYANENLL